MYAACVIQVEDKLDTMLGVSRDSGMKMNLLLAAVLLSACSLAYAEGGACPPGYYPIGGQGASGCAPFPDADSNEVPNPPSGRWVKTWGAIAIDPGRAKMGTSNGEMSERAAKKAAIADCHAQGGSKGCAIKFAYRNQCAVVVSGDNASSTARAESIEIATKIAMNRCINDGDGNCQVFYTACSGPVRIQ